MIDPIGMSIASVTSTFIVGGSIRHLYHKFLEYKQRRVQPEEFPGIIQRRIAPNRVQILIPMVPEMPIVVLDAYKLEVVKAFDNELKKELDEIFEEKESMSDSDYKLKSDDLMHKYKLSPYEKYKLALAQHCS